MALRIEKLSALEILPNICETYPFRIYYIKEASMGIFSKTADYIKDRLGKTRDKISSSLSSVLSLGRNIDDQLLNDLEQTLISDDIGVETTDKLISDLREAYRGRQIARTDDIIPFLKETTQGDSDFSLYGDDGPYSAFVEYYHEQMYQIFGGYAGNERRKWGVENLGLCLLLAWTNEIIQQGAGWYPNNQ